jgi:1-aminocyclopropane-1-carboxylate deaminase
MDKISQLLLKFGFDPRQEFSLERSILGPLQLPNCGNYGLYIQRDDLIHPVISGNKWRKLEGWVQYAKNGGYHTLVTFGGAYSNHLVATAAAGNMLGFNTIGLLRADEPITNHYLEISSGYGMDIRGISRELFREKSQLTSEFSSLEGHLVIPEGGQGDLAFEGFDQLVLSLAGKVDVILHASATATTAVGLALAIKKYHLEVKVKAILVLKNVQSQIEYATSHGVSEIIEFVDGYHFGGYAKTTEELMNFTSEFELLNQIVIDPVYTSKALWGMREMYLKGAFLGLRVAFLHTGGMLGRFSDKFAPKLEN